MILGKRDLLISKSWIQAIIVVGLFGFLILAILALGGHLKTGHTWTLQNRPTERNQNKSIYTPPDVI